MVSPGDARIRGLLDAEQAAVTALSHLAKAAAPPEVRACLEELRYAAAWFCAGLERRIPHPTTRQASPPGAVRHVVTDQVIAAPAMVDFLRLVNRSQRSVLARIDGLLVESLDPELRAFLEEARVILARIVTGCDGAISVPDRDRELRGGPRLNDPEEAQHGHAGNGSSDRR